MTKHTLTCARRVWETRRPDTSARTDSPVTKLLSARDDRESKLLNMCAACAVQTVAGKDKESKEGDGVGGVGVRGVGARKKDGSRRGKDGQRRK